MRHKQRSFLQSFCNAAILDRANVFHRFHPARQATKSRTATTAHDGIFNNHGCVSLFVKRRYSSTGGHMLGYVQSSAPQQSTSQPHSCTNTIHLQDVDSMRAIIDNKPQNHTIDASVAKNEHTHTAMYSNNEQQQHTDPISHDKSAANQRGICTCHDGKCTATCNQIMQSLKKEVAKLRHDHDEFKDDVTCKIWAFILGIFITAFIYDMRR